MKFAVGTVIFPGIEAFFPTFIQSLRSQTDQKFQLFIVNDGYLLSDSDLAGLKYTILSGGGSVTKNREILIHEILNQNYEWIVFCDADDWFHPNRIEVIRRLIPEYDLIANEIVPFNENLFFDPKFEKTLGNFCQINLDFILDKNLFGLSNVACHCSFLKSIVVPDEIIAVDWYVFTKVMQAGARACFTAETKTYYRQWSHNIIGIDKVSEKEIRTGVKVKYTHYKNLINTNPWFGKNINWLQNLYLNLENADFEYYVYKLRHSACVSTFWWENIKNYGDD